MQKLFLAGFLTIGLHIFFCTGTDAAAARREYKRPANLHCTSSGVGPAADFYLGAMDTLKPLTSLDARIDGTLSAGFEVAFCANNGCDNSYCFVFYRNDLDYLADGGIPELTGLMTYFNAQIMDVTPENLEIATRTLPITCKAVATTPDLGD